MNNNVIFLQKSRKLKKNTTFLIVKIKKEMFQIKRLESKKMTTSLGVQIPRLKSQQRSHKISVPIEI